MAGYHIDTFHCVTLMPVRTVLQRFAACTKYSAISFLISCANCLWDAVGYFLGGCSVGSGPSGMGVSGWARVNQACLALRRAEYLFPS